MNENPSRNDRLIGRWLFAVATLVALMIIVGGATRLTGSGLSMVNWDPIMGIVPPLSQTDWQDAFSAYQQSPEYHFVNRGMSLDEFKGIFWWEYGHRLLGRLIGLVFGLPLLVFLAKKMVRPSLKMPMFVLLALGGAQGLLGWYMVQSGLINEPAVSQYRLAAHLSLALLLLAALVWVAVNLTWPKRPEVTNRTRTLAWIVFAAVSLQMVLGAFVAGLDAGFLFNSWPLMEGRLVPAGLFPDTMGLKAAFEDRMTVQFLHRGWAYIVTILAIAAYFIRFRKGPAEARRYGHILMALVVMQVVVGILTLIYVVPVGLGVLHQSMGVAVFLAALVLANRLQNTGRASV